MKSFRSNLYCCSSFRDFFFIFFLLLPNEKCFSWNFSNKTDCIQRIDAHHSSHVQQNKEFIIKCFSFFIIMFCFLSLKIHFCSNLIWCIVVIFRLLVFCISERVFNSRTHASKQIFRHSVKACVMHVIACFNEKFQDFVGNIVKILLDFPSSCA